MLSPQDVTEPVTVRTSRGGGFGGAQHANPVTTYCQYDGSRKLVRGAAGAEVVSEVTIRLDPDTDGLDLEALFTPESKVTVRGRDSTVIAAKPHIDGGELIYLEVNLA